MDLTDRIIIGLLATLAAANVVGFCYLHSLIALARADRREIKDWLLYIISRTDAANIPDGDNEGETP